MYECETLWKLVEDILRVGRRKKENDRVHKPNSATLYTCKEMSQETPLHNYYVLIKYL
jgi:hypothetical protein